MASPAIVMVFFNDSSGNALTGLTPTFDTYVDDAGGAVTQPTITEVGGGFYKFTPVFPSNKGLAYVINGGATANPRRQYDFLVPEDIGPTFLTSIVNGVWDGLRSAHTVAGSFGSLMRLLAAVFAGRAEVDATVGTLKTYDLDGTTLRQTQTLAKADGATPAGLDAVKRGVADTLP
jgi:hypothetical protein